QELRGERRRALARLADFLDFLLDRAVAVQVIEQQIAVAQDDGEQIVEVVRHTASERPDGFQLLGLPQLLLQALPLAQVQDEGDDVRRVERRRPYQHGHERAIAPPVAPLAWTSNTADGELRLLRA